MDLQISWGQTSQWQLGIKFPISLPRRFHLSRPEAQLKSTFPMSLSSSSVTRDLEEVLAAEAQASACFQFARLFE